MMHVRANSLIVKRAYAGHCLGRQRRQVSCAEVFFDLSGAFGARDGAGDGWEHQNPPQGQLRERSTSGNKRTQSFHGAQASFIVHAGESFAAIEGFTLPIEITVVLGSESAVTRQF